MSAYKQFLSSDIIITPFEVNKSFNFEGENQLVDSDVNIDRFIGKNITDSLFNPLTDPTTGNDNNQYQRLIYNSVKELYYSNYISSSFGSPATTSSLIPGNNIEGDRYIGPTQSDGKYFNYNQTDLTFEKYFPTGSDSIIGVMSIPSRLYGNFIVPTSFKWIANSGSIYDDGEGNLIFSASGNICGQIYYPHGLAVITSNGITETELYGYGVYGTSIYGIEDEITIDNFITSTQISCSFSSSLTIYENQYKCTIRENEYNYSLNPSSLSNISDGSVHNFITSSYFNPYVTTIGLYDENQNLLAIGKLAQPLPLSPTTDTNIIINIDR